MYLWICRLRRAGRPSASIHSTRRRGSRAQLSVERWSLGDFRKAGERRIWPQRVGESVGLDEVAGELVVGSIGEDELDFVVGGEGCEVFACGRCWRQLRRRGI